MKKLEIFFNALEEREKYTLFVSLIFTILFLGVYFTLQNFENVKKLERKLEKEIKNYNELTKLAGTYASKKGSLIEKTVLNLAQIDNIAKAAGTKDKIQSIKPINYQGKDMYEITLEKVSPTELQNFINNLKKRKINIYFISIDNIRQDNNLKVRMTVGV